MEEKVKIAWLLQKATQERHPNDVKNIKTFLNEDLLKAFLINDPYQSAARILKGNDRSHYRHGLYRLVFLLAAYRLYKNRLRLTVTRREVDSLEAEIDNIKMERLILWIKDRSIVIMGREDSNVRRSWTFSFTLPFNALRSGKKPILKVKAGECHLLYTEKPDDLTGLCLADNACEIGILPKDSKGFDDLSLRWNIKIAYMLYRRPAMKAASSRWLSIAGLSDSLDERLGSMPEGKKQLFHLALMGSSEAYRVLIIDKSSFDFYGKMSFWHLIAALVQSARAVLVISREASDLLHAHRYSVVTEEGYLGELGYQDIRNIDEFIWVKGRVINPSLAVPVPSYLCKTSPISGEFWLAIKRPMQKSERFISFMREKYGLTIIPEATASPSMEEKIIYALKRKLAPFDFTARD